MQEFYSIGVYVGARTLPLTGSYNFTKPGAVIGGKYKILSFIGEGSIACVFIVENIYTGGKAALKF